jgi:hypothetical protein
MGGSKVENSLAPLLHQWKSTFKKLKTNTFKKWIKKSLKVGRSIDMWNHDHWLSKNQKIGQKNYVELYVICNFLKGN